MTYCSEGNTSISTRAGRSSLPILSVRRLALSTPRNMWLHIPVEATTTFASQLSSGAGAAHRRHVFSLGLSRLALLLFNGKPVCTIDVGMNNTCIGADSPPAPPLKQLLVFDPPFFFGGCRVQLWWLRCIVQRLLCEWASEPLIGSPGPMVKKPSIV